MLYRGTGIIERVFWLLLSREGWSKQRVSQQIIKTSNRTIWVITKSDYYSRATTLCDKLEWDNL